jgi:hypothetical protein
MHDIKVTFYAAFHTPISDSAPVLKTLHTLTEANSISTTPTSTLHQLSGEA